MSGYKGDTRAEIEHLAIQLTESEETVWMGEGESRWPLHRKLILRWVGRHGECSLSAVVDQWAIDAAVELGFPSPVTATWAAMRAKVAEHERETGGARG